MFDFSENPITCHGKFKENEDFQRASKKKALRFIGYAC